MDGWVPRQESALGRNRTSLLPETRTTLKGKNRVSCLDVILEFIMENKQRIVTPYFQPFNSFIVTNYNCRWRICKLHLPPNETPPAFVNRYLGFQDMHINYLLFP